MKTGFSLTLCLAAALSTAALPGAAAAQGMPVIPLQAGIHVIRAEVAANDPARMQGLMFRKGLDQNSGMLFVFTDQTKHCMWMKNTLIPLSVAFINEKGVIVSIHDMAPQTENSHCAAAPSVYALEMTGGWFKSKGIKAGAKIGGLDKAPAPQ